MNDSAARAGSPVILWFRQDLRLHDHAALHAAIATGRAVLPVFILDDAAAGAWAPGGAARWWLHHSLSSLEADLRQRGAKLALRRGAATTILTELVAVTGATEVFTSRPVEPWARRQDQDVSRAIAAHGAKLRRHITALLFDPDAIRTQAGGVFGVYTPFSRACFAQPEPPPPLPAPAHIPGASARGEPLADWALLPTSPDWAAGLRATWIPGEAGAARRLADFIARGIDGYDERRNLPGIDATSMLSPHLHWGELSPGQVWHAARAAEVRPAGRLTFLKEVLWREFSAYLLWHHPTLPEAPLRPEFAAMPWRADPEALRAWQRGRTGIPIVDAGMRQLWHTGWMHNRVRMIVASFLIKHLMIRWQDGQRWFWDTLVDADLASNAASWQWVAGSGADAAPYFRVFNPVLQGRKFDPDGAYVRRYVPELAGLDAATIHAPWEGAIPTGYPKPMVDLADGRERALAAYARITRRAG